MPIVLPEGLPAVAALRGEGLDVATYPSGRGWPAESLDTGRTEARSLKVALVNLMPDKITTEIQLARLLGGSSSSLQLVLVLPDGYQPKTAPASHLRAFYHRWSEVRDMSFDGLIVTGAPVEHLPFETVSYWRGLQEILDHSGQGGCHSLFICWAAQAALYHLYGVSKRCLAEKAFGVFRQAVVQSDAAVLRGIGGSFPVPVSRHTEVAAEDLPQGRLRILAGSSKSGLCLLDDPAASASFMFNHFEYDTETLAGEYARDLARGEKIGVPVGYFPEDDPEQRPVNTWKRQGQLFFRNWVNELARTRPYASPQRPTAMDRLVATARSLSGARREGLRLST